MRNFTEVHLHVIENVGCRCKICEGSICKLWKEQVEDAKFLRKASSGHRKGKM